MGQSCVRRGTITTLVILAEISDKMPSTACMVGVSVASAGACAGLAAVSRVVAWVLLFLTALAGGFVAYAIAADALPPSPMRDAIWSELGWTWVCAGVAGPLPPALCVALVVLFRRPCSRGFPV